MRKRVSSYDVGPDHRLTVPGVLRQFHDTAQAHAASYGFGYRSLEARGLAWALVCIDLGFRESAPLGESILATATSVYRATGPVVLRDYRASVDSGAVYAEGQAMWALIDLETRKTATPDAEMRTLLGDISTATLNAGSARRLPAGAPLPPGDERAVALHDCDFNGHLNNVSAVAWMLDQLYAHALPAADRREGDGPGRLVGLSPKRIRVSYHTEALFGERVRCHLAGEGDTYRTELRALDGRLIANAVTEL